MGDELIMKKVKNVLSWVLQKTKTLNNLKLFIKLLISFFLITALCGIVGFVGMSNIKNLISINQEVFDKLNFPMVYITNLNETYYKMKSNMIEAVYNERSLSAIQNISNFKSQITYINESLNKTWGDDERILAEKYNEAISTLLNDIDIFLGYINSGNREKAEEYLNNTIEENLFFLEMHIKNITDTKTTGGRKMIAQSESESERNLAVMSVILAIILLLSVLIGLLLSFSVSGRIKNLIRVAQRLAVGDTTLLPTDFSKDEVGQLSRAFANMINNISEQAAIIEKIGQGDTDVFIEPKSENDMLSKGILNVIGNLDSLMNEINYLISESKNQNFDAVGDISKFLGRNKEIVEGINQTLALVREKIFWYQEMLDSIPVALLATDRDYNFTFVNKPVQEFFKLEREEMVGKPCDVLNVGLCREKGCRMDELGEDEKLNIINIEDSTFQVSSHYVYGPNGEETGQIELVQDITARMRALEYQKQEVERLSRNLKLFADGNLNLDFEVGEGDEYTIEERKLFTEINNSFAEAIHSIYSYIQEITNALSEMSEGNLNVVIASDFKGDYIQIKNSINSIIDSFNSIIGAVNVTAGQVAAGARQVSEGSRNLSQGASEQASSVEELTAAIAQVASQTKSNASSASETNQLTLDVKNNAAQGNVYMKEMLEVIDKINESCNNISKIIKVIDEIAFQTNILALNASVEAARAGQHGKGFAVVAEEVRNLATRSANAAKETEALIESSLNVAKQGTVKAQQTYEALNVIVDGVDKAAELLGAIARASEDQANAIAQINRGVEQVSKVVQTNSATSEESAAASEELLSQAEQLKSMVGRFALRDEYTYDEEVPSFEPLGKKEDDVQGDDGDDEMIKIELGSDDFGKY